MQPLCPTCAPYQARSIVGEALSRLRDEMGLPEIGLRLTRELAEDQEALLAAAEYVSACRARSAECRHTPGWNRALNRAGAAEVHFLNVLGQAVPRAINAREGQEN